MFFTVSRKTLPNGLGSEKKKNAREYRLVEGLNLHVCAEYELFAIQDGPRYFFRS